MSDSEKATRKRFAITYKESPHYRHVQVNGAYGGPTPSGDVFMAVYSDRLHFPDSGIIEINDEGESLPETIEAKRGLVREVEVGITMSLETAKALQIWLEAKIKMLNEMAAKAAQRSEAAK